LAPVSETTKHVDVHWDDDEDETTHIFDRTEDAVPRFGGAAAVPAAGTPPPSAVKGKVTLLGVNATTLPTHQPTEMASSSPVRSAPPPGVESTRPAAQNPFTIPSSFPAPPLQHLPAPPTTQQGLGSHAPGAFIHTPTPPPAELHRPVSIPPSIPVVRRPLDSMRGPTSGEVTALLRPQKPQNRATLWAAGGLVAALILALVFLLIPQTGRLMVDVSVPQGMSANHLEIFVDGRKQCDTAPCIIDPMSAGVHEVKLIAEGFDNPPVQSITISARHDTSAAFLLGAERKHTELKVSGTQPGVKLFIDDKEIGPVPQDVRDIVPGEHIIKLLGSERYVPVERHVTFQSDSVVDLGTVVLKVTKGKATITLGTPGAHVFLTSGSDRRELPTIPISVDIDTSKSWILQATKPGYFDYSQSISFDDGQAEKSYAVELEARAVATPTWTPPPPAAAPVVAPAAAAAPAPAPVAAAPHAAGETAGADAFLNINSIPVSTCFLDGKSLGSTPRINVSVKPGTHAVKFVNSEQGLTKTVTVTVGAGETKAAVARLN